MTADGIQEAAVTIIGTCHCGSSGWCLEGDPGLVTACNCTLCRRYGALWAYDYEGERIRISGPSAVYTRPGKADLPIDHLDGLDSFDDLPSDGRCVRDLWF
jgi:hypothetical protein